MRLYGIRDENVATHPPTRATDWSLKITKYISTEMSTSHHHLQHSHENKIQSEESREIIPGHPELTAVGVLSLIVFL
jgi:hypothetical protein